MLHHYNTHTHTHTHTHHTHTHHTHTHTHTHTLTTFWLPSQLTEAATGLRHVQAVVLPAQETARPTCSGQSAHIAETTALNAEADDVTSGTRWREGGGRGHIIGILLLWMK